MTHFLKGRLSLHHTNRAIQLRMLTDRLSEIASEYRTSSVKQNKDECIRDIKVINEICGYVWNKKGFIYEEYLKEINVIHSNDTIDNIMKRIQPHR